MAATDGQDAEPPPSLQQSYESPSIQATPPASAITDMDDTPNHANVRFRDVSPTSDLIAVAKGTFTVTIEGANGKKEVEEKELVIVRMKVSSVVLTNTCGLFRAALKKEWRQAGGTFLPFTVPHATPSYYPLVAIMEMLHNRPVRFRDLSAKDLIDTLYEIALTARYFICKDSLELQIDALLHKFFHRNTEELVSTLRLAFVAMEFRLPHHYALFTKRVIFGFKFRKSDLEEESVVDELGGELFILALLDQRNAVTTHILAAVSTLISKHPRSLASEGQSMFGASNSGRLGWPWPDMSGSVGEILTEIHDHSPTPCDSHRGLKFVQANQELQSLASRINKANGGFCLPCLREHGEHIPWTECEVENHRLPEEWLDHLHYGRLHNL